MMMSLSCSKSAHSWGLIGTLAEPSCKVNPFQQQNKKSFTGRLWLAGNRCMPSYMGRKASWWGLEYTQHWWSNKIIFFSCDQAALWMVQSVPPSVRLSVTPSWLCSHRRIIMKFSEVKLPMAEVMSTQKVQVRGQRSKSQRSKPDLAVSGVWIQIWWWNDAQGLMLLRRGALLFFKVICPISRSHS